jgi:hypothetical protein
VASGATLEIISDARIRMEGKVSLFALWVGVSAQRVVCCVDVSWFPQVSGDVQCPGGSGIAKAKRVAETACLVDWSSVGRFSVTSAWEPP